MSVEKTAAGTWRARWREEGPAGDRVSRSKNFARKIDAERFLAARLTDLARGTYVPPEAEPVTVAAMADEWLAGALNLRPSSLATYRRDLDRYILPALGKHHLQRLTPAAVSKFLADELAAGLAPSSVLRHYRTIRRLCAVAVRQGRLTANPCDRVDPPRVEPTEVRFLTVAQIDALADAIHPRYRAWVLVSAWGGLRWSETVGLRRSAVDPPKVTVTEQLLRSPAGEWYREQPKTAAGRRTVHLPPHVAEVLAAHLDEHVGPEPGALVFTTVGGAPVAHSNFRSRYFRPALERAGLDLSVRIHDLRHTAVALAIAAGAHPKAIQARMGHANIAVTMDRYGHLFDSADADLAAALGGLRP